MKPTLGAAFTSPRRYVLRLAMPTVVVATGAYVTQQASAMYGGAVLVPTAVSSTTGFILGLLLVFRFNSAYDRWWSGRKLLGELVAAGECMTLAGCSSVGPLMRCVGDALVDGDEEALRRGSAHLAECDRTRGPGSTDRAVCDAARAIQALWAIKSTPAPLSYALHVRAVLGAYLVTTALGPLSGLGAWAVPAVALAFYAAAGVEIMAVEIEDPFRGDPNDLQVREILTQRK